MRADRRDANEREIVAFWRSVGCVWIPMHPGQGFDGLLVARNGVHIVEIKNGEKPWKVTQAEEDLSRQVYFIGQEYHIIETLEAAAHLIGLEATK